MKKKITAIIVVMLSFSLIFNIFCSRISRSNEATDNLVEGLKLVAYELEMYTETEDEEYFNQAATDFQTLTHVAQNNNRILTDSYKEETFLSLGTAFRYEAEKLKPYAQELKRICELIAENADNTYPYDRINIILQDI